VTEWIRYKDPVLYPLIQVGDNRWIRQKEDEFWMLGYKVLYLGAVRFIEIGSYTGSAGNKNQ
jgi:hypothetical protein